VIGYYLRLLATFEKVTRKKYSSTNHFEECVHTWHDQMSKKTIISETKELN